MGIEAMMVPYPVCPECNSEFVEQVESGSHPENFAYDGDTGDETDDYEEIYNELADAARNGTNGANFTFNMMGIPAATTGGADGLMAALQAAFQNAATGNTEGGTGGNATGTTTSGTTNEATGETAPTSQDEATSTGTATGNANANPNQPPNPINMISNLLGQVLAGQGLQGGVATNVNLNPLMGNFFNMVGNPGDYVMGQAGLDNIITRLMEQQQGRDAPPPAPEDRINSLPKIKIGPTEISDNYECAVCKDEFALEEECLQLPCSHTFHDGCIRPWLKLNGTCPTCRFSLNTPAETQPSQ